MSARHTQPPSVPGSRGDWSRAVLVELQQRLSNDYGDGAAARTLIDRVIAARHDFIRLTGWIAHLSLTVEQERFGDKGAAPGARTRSTRTKPGSPNPVERHLVQYA